MRIALDTQSIVSVAQFTLRDHCATAFTIVCYNCTCTYVNYQSYLPVMFCFPKPVAPFCFLPINMPYIASDDARHIYVSLQRKVPNSQKLIHTIPESDFCSLLAGNHRSPIRSTTTSHEADANHLVPRLIATTTFTIHRLPTDGTQTLAPDPCMSSRWLKRRTRLRELLTISTQDEDEEALAIDRVLHGQNVIGKTGIYHQLH